MIEGWTLVLMLAGRELTSGPVDPYRCRMTELRIAARHVAHYDGKRIVGAVCLRHPSKPVVLTQGVPA